MKDFGKEEQEEQEEKGKQDTQGVLVVVPRPMLHVYVHPSAWRGRFSSRDESNDCSEARGVQALLLLFLHVNHHHLLLTLDPQIPSPHRGRRVSTLIQPRPPPPTEPHGLTNQAVPSSLASLQGDTGGWHVEVVLGARLCLLIPPSAHIRSGMIQKKGGRRLTRSRNTGARKGKS
eukprot:766531-Hanusia_phi.AAC.3